MRPSTITVQIWEPTDENEDNFVRHEILADEVAVPDEVVASLIRQGKIGTNEGVIFTLQNLFDLVME